MKMNDNAEQDLDKYLVPGLLRGLKVLELFNDNQKEYTLTEIAEALNINRSSAFRLVHTLEYSGYLRKGTQKSYCLDSKVMQLGYSALSHMNLTDIAQPIMTELRNQTTLATHLAILNKRDLVYISNIQALGAFTSNIHTGTRWPAYATVIGQILLSALSDEEIQALFKDLKDWTVYSQNTPQNIDELIARVNYARTQEYLISWGKFKPDMIACAVPILNQKTQKPIAALSVSCPITMFDNKENFISKIVPHVIQAGEKISNFFY